MVTLVIVVLVIVIIGLAAYNLSIYKKIEGLKNINQKIISLNIIQEFMDIIGEDVSSRAKIEKMNDILLQKYDIKYSSIVVFDGARYTMLASNVEQKHWQTLTNLSTEEVFSDSIATASIKYLTVEKSGDRLPYQKMEFERAKSVIFLPLYIDNVYIGYWIIESDRGHAFDSIDNTVLEAVKQNIVSIIKSMEYQNIIENTVKKDEFSELYTKEYLFGEGKSILNQSSTSAICMLSIINLPEINEKHGRDTGNYAITALSDIVTEDLSEKYIFVRYMGPKFVIAFPGIDVDSVIDFLQGIKSKIETENLLDEEESAEGDTKKKKKKNIATAMINIALTTYYKGTRLEGTTNELENYINNADKTESEINII